MSSKHDDKILIEHIGICQFFTRQNFPNLDSSKFSTIKILSHTVTALVNYFALHAFMFKNNNYRNLPVLEATAFQSMETWLSISMTRKWRKKERARLLKGRFQGYTYGTLII